MADYAVPKNGVAYIFYGCLVSQADTKLFKSGPTLAAGDFKVDIDGAGLTNFTNLPTVSPAASVLVAFSMTAAEMNGDVITMVCIDQTSPKEWADFVLSIPTTA